MLDSTHNTVSVLIQDKPEVVQGKPLMSSTNVIHGSKRFIGLLPCQKVGDPMKLNKSWGCQSLHCTKNEVFH